MAGPLHPRLLRESGAARRHLATAAALGVLGALLLVAQAALLAYVIDRAALQREGLATVSLQLAALAAVLLARALVSGGFELSAGNAASEASSQLRTRLAAHLLRPAGAIADPRTRPGELASAAVQGADALRAYFAGYLPQLTLAASVPLAVLGYAAFADPIAAGILALTIPILIAFMVLVGKTASAQTRRRWRALSLLSSHFLDVVQGLPTLRAHRRAAAQADTLAAVGERYRAETLATLRIAFLSAFVLELCAMLGTALVAATIGVQLVAGDIGLTAGLAVLLLAPELYAPLRAVGQQFHAAADGTAAADAIHAVLDAPPALDVDFDAPPAAAVDVDFDAPPASAVNVDSDAPPAPALPDPATQPLTLHHVHYEYPERAGVALHDVSVELSPGHVTAIVGPSGAGKSTLARLLMRLADPTSGSVSCGGVDLRSLDPERWRSQVAWLPQRPLMIAGSVAENIALGAPGASASAIEQAARDAGALRFVEELPSGMQTRIGDGGRRLSAGQRQRIALARALLRRPRLLVLDEPTANLDEDSGRRVAETIARTADGRTTLLIVHHPLLAEHADRVLRLEHGRLVEQPAAATQPPATTQPAATTQPPATTRPLVAAHLATTAAEPSPHRLAGAAP